MAIRFPGTGTSYLDYVGGSPDTNNCTVVGWAFLATDRNDFSSCLPRFRNSGDSTTLWLGLESSGTTVAVATPSSGSFSTTYDMTVGKWSRIAFTSTGGTGTAYAADPDGTVITASGALSGNTPAAKYCFGARGPSDSTESFDGSLAGFKIYNGTLTLAELRAEWSQILPVRTAGLYAAYPMDLNSIEGRLDYSGNGRTLVLGGSALSTQEGPPIRRERISFWRRGAVLLASTGGGSTSGAVAGSLPAPTGALAGALSAAGALQGPLPIPSGALTGNVSASGVLAGSLPSPTGGLAGTVTASGVIAGSLPAPAGSLTGTSTITGALAGNLPTPTDSLAGVVMASGAVAGSLPAPTGALVAALISDGAIGSSLPTPSGALTGTSTITGALAGSLPTPVGTLTSDTNTTGVVAGILPIPAGALTATAVTPGTISAQLPVLSGALAGNIISTAVMAGSFAPMSGALTGVVLIPGVIAGNLPQFSGFFDDLIPGVFHNSLPGMSGVLLGELGAISFVLDMEVIMQRINTKAFIAEDPITISLHTRTVSRSSTGGVLTAVGTTRAAQVFKLIMISPAGGSIEQRTQDGTERQVDFILLGEWNAQIAVGDWWEDVNDNRWEVKALMPTNGYEIRAVVEAHGKILEGG